MSVLSDKEIIERCNAGMITPFSPTAVKEENGNKIISYGVSAYGYDIRVANEFKLFYSDITTIYNYIDPKITNTQFPLYYEKVADEILIPPNSMMLCRSVEYFRIPRDIMCIAVGKSTYARCGIIANITPLEAEWEGYLTIELSNTTPLPVKIYVNEGIAQLVFFKAENMCEISYKDKDGKYQGQTGVTGAKM
jgi:dCTP deaminase